MRNAWRCVLIAETCRTCIDCHYMYTQSAYFLIFLWWDDRSYARFLCFIFVVIEALRSPFFPYLAVTFGLNLPPVIYALKSTVDWCPDVSNWLVSNALMAIIHMCASMYIVSKIRGSGSTANAVVTTNKQQQAEEGKYYQTTVFGVPDEHGAANSCARMKHVMCYDKVVAIYILVFLCWIYWLAVGIGRSFGNDEAEGAGCGDQGRYVGMAISLGYLYICLVGVAFAISLCCLR